MSGTYEMNGRGTCWANYHDSLNTGTYDYVFNRNYWMRENVPKCQTLSLGANCSFYGPKDVTRTTQESFLQGRGQVENDKCPDADVIYLPEAVFAMGNRDKGPQCQRTDLEPHQDRQNRACFNISETESTSYAFMPGAWQTGYSGANDFCDDCKPGCSGGTLIQSREDARDMYKPRPQPNNMSRGSYGSYDDVGPAYYGTL